MVRSLSTLLSLTLLAPAAFAASADDWKSRSIYQLVTDRFNNVKDSSASCNSEDRKYCGGTYQGIIDKLDYIKGMGFDAIWISPVVKNVDGETANGFAYHGYWTEDLNSLNSNFGSADDLKSLATALHGKGMYLMVDVVVNHFVANPSGASLPQTFDYSSLLPLSASSDFHPECFITDYNNQTDVEQCWLGDASMPLLDVDTENSTIAQIFNDWVGNLVKEYSVDGIRIDTVKHVRKDFWPAFASSAGVFTIGEVLNGDTSYVANYTEVLDNVLDYPTWYPLTRAFNTTSGSMSDLATQYTAGQGAFKNGLFTAGSFLENQDQARFQSHTTDDGLVKNAITWTFINDAIPILYYGQEQGYTGGEDPYNREALWFSGYETSKPLVEHVTSLNAARKLAISVNKDFTSTASKFIGQSDESTLAISKPPLLTLLTNAGSSGSASWSIPSSASLFSKGDTVVDVVSCNTYTVDSSSGDLSITASSGLPKVIVPKSKLDGSVCSTTTDGALSVAANRTLLVAAVAGIFLSIL
ncbi:glycoside hydrolase family 13 protein [Hymenopellis radicata]|nr:glycoside hydrolase family 13 protein [Hymenopellis radicata]